jgi:hypothetical protein
MLLRGGRMFSLLCVAIAICATGLSPRASAQPEASTNDLRRENDQLRERVAQLQAQVAERNKRIKELEDRVKELEKGGAPATPTTPPASPPATKAPDATPPATPSGPVAAPPEDAFASPESMFTVLSNEYAEAVGSLPRESEADIKRYLREVSKWAKAAERKHRGNIDWVILVQKVTEEAGRTTIEYRVLDPGSGLPYGTSPSQLSLTGRLAKQLTDQPNQKTWKLTGSVAAKPAVNPDRAEPTLFNVPKLIGPFAEFGFDVTVNALTPILAPGRAPVP